MSWTVLTPPAPAPPDSGGAGPATPVRRCRLPRREDQTRRWCPPPAHSPSAPCSRASPKCRARSRGPHPCPPQCARVFNPVEAFRNSLLIHLADARDRIGDLDAHLGQGGAQWAAVCVSAPGARIDGAVVRPGVGPQRQLPAGGRELQAVAHQVVEHLQKQIPITPNPWQLGFALQLQRHPLFLGIEPVGAQGLLHRHLNLLSGANAALEWQAVTIGRRSGQLEAACPLKGCVGQTINQHR